jgi:BirA family transcriptional regulator, biotin operon repressor / biotin---[acetyl-CoA-carboxylase] ligase
MPQPNRGATVTTLDRHARVAALLGGPLGWHSLVHLPEVTSTNDEVLARLRDGSPPGLVVVADHQTAGRGRLGRPWDDASAGATSGAEVRSLTVSTAVALPEAHAGLVPLAVGLAVADTFRRAGTAPALKWPNDVLLPTPDGGLAKAAGVLVERHTVAGRDVLVIGTGLDLDWRHVDRTGDAATWTSVAEATGGEVDRGEVLADLLRGEAVWLRSLATDPVRLLGAYRDACATIGREVEVTLPDGEVLRGRAVDLDRDGRLVVDAADHGRVAVTAGDVRHVRPS